MMSFSSDKTENIWDNWTVICNFVIMTIICDYEAEEDLTTTKD